MLRQTATRLQWLRPCGYVAMPFSGRPIDLTDSENRGRWRG